MITPSAMFNDSMESGSQREYLPVIASSGPVPVSGNADINLGVDFPVLGREIFISNDDATNYLTITVTCNGGTLAWILNAGETINERLPLFNRVVVVTSATAWRWYIRGNLS